MEAEAAVADQADLAVEAFQAAVGEAEADGGEDAVAVEFLGRVKRDGGAVAEAKQVLKSAVNRDNDNPFAWYQLGMIYDQEGDTPRGPFIYFLNEGHPGNGQAYIAQIAETNDPRWTDVLDGLEDLAAQLGIPMPDDVAEQKRGES